MRRIRRLILTILALVAIVTMAVPNGVFARGPEEFTTGLNEPTPEQAQWMKQNFPVIQTIRLNQVAFDRINADREARGMAPLPASHVDLAPVGKEAVFAPGRNDVETTTGFAALPPSIDNSNSEYFPPIGDQGSIGSCVAWATTYYQLSYETNRALGRTISPDDYSYIFSPKWTYNMINGGVDGGSYFSDAYDLELKNGAATISQFPYDTDYRAWDMESSDWNGAISYRPQTTGSLYNSNVDTMINSIKTTLLDGHIMVIGTYVYSWVMDNIDNDGSTSADDPFVGQYIASYEKNTRQGGHGMTIVGYNDAIWCDLNSNGVVDPGEKGAFKIANSWGDWWNDGFVWITYDSLRTTSAVSGWSTSRNSGGIFYSGSVWVLTVDPYVPTIKAEVTLNQAKRGQVAVTLGTGPTSSITPTRTWASKAVYNTGGNYAFDGTTTTVDGTFFFDFTDLADANPDANRWFVGIRDNRRGSVTTIKSFKLYDGDTVVAEMNTPRTVDSGQVYVWVDYTAGTPGNQPPVAYSQNITTNEDTSVDITLTGDDGDPGLTQALTFALATGPAHGSLSGFDSSTGELTYTPSLNYNGADSFTFTTNDGFVTSAPAMISITINKGNGAPVAYSQSITTDKDTPVNITLNGSDPDGDNITFEVASGPLHGILTGVAPDLTYTPDAGFTGSDSFTFTTNDGELASAPATVSITVNTPMTATFSISASPAARNVKRGNSTSYTVTLTSIGEYDSLVALSAEGSADVVISFSSDEVTPTGTSVMTVTTSDSTQKDTYTITITGIDGEITQSTTVSLKVR